MSDLEVRGDPVPMLPDGPRLVLVAFDAWTGLRTPDGRVLSVQWGEPDKDGIWTPTITAAPASPSPDWREAVIAVVDACDTELDGGGADDFERGADAAYSWVLAVIPGEVLAAARARLSEDSR